MIAPRSPAMAMAIDVALMEVCHCVRYNHIGDKQSDFRRHLGGCVINSKFTGER